MEGKEAEEGKEMLLLHSSDLQSFTGLFDLSSGSEYVRKKIVKCIDLAKDGIHAAILVFSVRTRFTEGQETALFGSKIVDYMIVFFTGGDDLEESKESLGDYLGRESPKALETSDPANPTSTAI
ncbi:hypothetical protein VIGAN_10191800 [Vigna angularis var. angularis]|uniref:AIG1-type G domain-containing protein n=1 Tax=Vigna angularis var. angularis TaxID=157739 RepID=A0A0S3T5I8_PHAAN|nr:hypothetical protein VIGAN_10191800 [Vigna angularis var. angularis]